MTTNNKTPVPTRPELDRFESYQPGLSIEQIKRQFNLKSVIKLASNENPRGTSQIGLKAYDKVRDIIFRYPETRSIDLRQVVAEKHNRDLSEVIIGAGSDEIIELLAKAFLTPADDIVVSASAFMQYRIAGTLMGARIITVPMTNYRHDLKGMAQAATRNAKLVFIANPNNPTGTYNSRSEVEEFLNLLPPTCLPVFDEAYFEYASVHEDYPSMAGDLFGRRPIVVLRTFSKIYGLAGLRVGYGMAPASVVGALDRIRPPFNVSIPAQAAASAALSDDDFIRSSVDMNEKQKAILCGALAGFGFEVIPSATNFVLFKPHPRTGRSLFDQLLRKGVIARCVDEYGLPDYLRVTVGMPGEVKIFLKALREVLDNS